MDNSFSAALEHALCGGQMNRCFFYELRTTDYELRVTNELRRDVERANQ
jgi:hypothetical protein